ncbi:SDR family NAD(P)-dependent oxidoreductase [Amycolatopsis halotolerans]|uniref:SDR family NAD(P)-dependent oxidoreductase n=1 Tax=Amycolatopsis halotolerans TaxID=330083 RepID=UPI0036237486
MTTRPTAVVLGAGPGLGMSMAQPVRRRGLPIALVSRTAERHPAYLAEFENAEAFVGDVRDGIGTTLDEITEVLAVGPVRVVVHLAGVHRNAQPEGQFGILVAVPGEQFGQRGHDAGEQHRLRDLVDRPDEAQRPVAPVDERVPEPLGDAPGQERLVEQVEQDRTEPGPSRVRTGGRPFDVDHHDGSVYWCLYC